MSAIGRPMPPRVPGQPRAQPPARAPDSSPTSLPDSSLASSLASSSTLPSTSSSTSFNLAAASAHASRHDASSALTQAARASGASSPLPAWTDRASLAAIAARAAPAAAVSDRPSSTSVLPGAGNAVRMRAAALLGRANGSAAPAPPSSATTEATTPTPTTSDAPSRARGLSLLDRARRAVAVVGGVPLSAADVQALGSAVHLTTAAAVDPILRQGLKPTRGVYKNLTAWCCDTVYLFPRLPNAVQRFMNFAEATSRSTEVIEVDLRKLDPDKLYKRVLDGAILYLSNDPIPASALRHRGTLDAPRTRPAP